MTLYLLCQTAKEDDRCERARLDSLWPLKFELKQVRLENMRLRRKLEDECMNNIVIYRDDGIVPHV